MSDIEQLQEHLLNVGKYLRLLERAMLRLEERVSELDGDPSWTTLRAVKVGRGSTPEYQTNGAAGIDLYTLDSFTLKPGERHVAELNAAVAIPRNCVGLLCIRSGKAAKMGLGLANGVGIIDEDYRGILKAIVINNNDCVVDVLRNTPIAQLVIVPTFRPSIDWCAELDPTERGAGGLGSTDKRTFKTIT